jgi:serine phosphatase RsbU (regulator of sigma subunit)
MNFRLLILSAFVSLMSFSSRAGSEIDSLRSALDSASGSSKAKLFNELCLRFIYLNADTSIMYGNEALQMARKHKSKVLEAHSLNNLGNGYLVKGNLKKALDHYIEAEKEFRSIKDDENALMTEMNIGLVYEKQELYDKALNQYNQTLKAAQEVNNKYSIAQAMNHIGSLYYQKDDKNRALDYFSKSLEINRSLNNTERIMEGLNNVAVVYQELGNYEQSLKYHHMFLDYSRKMEDKRSVAISLHNIGLVHKDEKQFEQAILYIDSSIYVAVSIDDFDDLQEMYKSLSEIYQEQGNYEKALENFRLSGVARDSSLSRVQSRQIVEMATKYETEKKETEIKLLSKEKERQKLITYSSTGGFLLACALTFFIYRGYREKKTANQMLERKQVEIVSKNKALKVANKIIQEKNKDITDSIRYAKRLQSAILKPENGLKECFDDGFIFFRPKDIVSGDFYWFEKFGNLSLVAAADCTGHGVPGAFMSIIGCNLLSQSVNEYAITQPAAILNSVNKGLAKVLQQKNEQNSVTDGMDIALCAFNSDKMVVEYAGAYNPVWHLRDGVITEYKANKFPVGAFVDKQVRIFNNHEIPVAKGDWLYIFSDGYADQFGGPEGKKFKYKQFQKLFTDNYKLAGTEQRTVLESTFEAWIGNLEQIDDLLVIGIKI